MNLNNMRKAFGNQNGQCLIIDIADMNVNYINNLTKVLQDILTLACSVRGGVRIPLFSLSVLTKINTELFEFDVLRGNYNKIQNALNAIVTYCQTNKRISIQEYKDSVYHAIDSTVRTFVSKQSKYDWIHNIEHIEITFVTVKNCHTVQSYIENVILRMDVTKIKKISVIELHDYDTEIIENKWGITQIIKIDGANLHDMKDFFKNWLLDECNSVSLILHFPNSNFSIKCDINECIINPLSLPFGHRIYLQTDSLSVKMTGISSTKTATPSVPIYQLNILSRLSGDAICESTLLGLPLCLKATSSWTLSLEEEENNQECFYELCKQLENSAEFLLAQMRSHFQTDQFQPYFVITSGDNCLLLKSFAASDLVLPWIQNKKMKGTSNENKRKVMENLKALKCEKVLNPNNYESGLLTALRANLKHAKRESNTDTDESSVAKRNKRTK